MLDFWIFRGHLLKNPAEHAVGDFHDIVFDHAGDAFAAVGTGVGKGVARDALATGAGDQFEALRHFRRLLVFDAGVEIFFVFADDGEVDLGAIAQEGCQLETGRTLA